MTREEARDFVNRQEPTFLERARKKINGRYSYICPNCGNGEGSDGTGISYNPKNGHYKCFKCGISADIIDLYGRHYGIDDPAEKFKGVYQYYGIEIDDNTGHTYNNNDLYTNTPRKNSQKPHTGHKVCTMVKCIDHEKENAKTGKYEHTEGSGENAAGQEATDNRPEDLTNFFLEAESLNNFEYLKRRGISEAIQKRFHVGFVPDWVSPQAVKTTIDRGGDPGKIPRSPRCIIPTGNSSYIARDTREGLTDEQKRYSKQKQGQQPLFNIQALEDCKAVFVVEGEIDAMSVEEAGGKCIGLGSAANVRRLAEYLKDHHSGQVMILCLDNDTAGQDAQKQLSDELNRLNIGYIDGMRYACEGVKDPNEALIKDPEAFREAVSSLKAEALAMTAGLSSECRAADLLDYFRHIEECPEGMEAKTGFSVLDEKMQGGIHEGLYIIGAISSLGKTTFSLQLADQIAAAGTDVIFFSLEMSKIELIAKSISRYSFQDAGLEKEKDRFVARDTSQILNNRRYKYYSRRERETISNAIELYSLPAQNIYIYEGRYKGQRLNVQHIKEIAREHREKTGKTPVIFVDYLQIIAPADPRGNDKQNTDTAVFELKELSRDLKTAVFAISSFNRDNYKEPVNMASFKESGAVEYSSDVLFGLQYAGMDYQEGESEKDRSRRLRDLMQDIYRKKEQKEFIKIELKCLKNRNGYQFTIPFQMLCAFNYFEESQEAEGGQEFRKCMASPFDNAPIM